MIDFSIPEETFQIIETVRRFIDSELRPIEQIVDDQETIPQELASSIRDKARALGLYAMDMPASVGGGGLSTVDMCLVEEQFGWTSDVLVRRAFGAVPATLMSCFGAQREKYLLPAVAGDIIVAFAMSEAGAGSDAAGIKTVAMRDGDDYILNGSKHFISDANVADAFMVTALTDPGKGHRGISLFLVDRDAEGVTVGREQRLMGLHGLSHCELFFNNVRLPQGQRLGQEGEGMALALGTGNRQRLRAVAARAVGTASRLLQMSLEYANERKQFGTEIASFQMIQAMLADMAVDIYAARSMVLNAAWDVDQGREPRTKISMVKLFASEMLGRVADKAVQIFGGMGYCSEMPVERLYRDARVQRILDGTSEIHRVAIARDLLKRGLSI